MNASQSAASMEQPQPTARRVLIVDQDTTVALVTQHSLQAMLGKSAKIGMVSSARSAWVQCQHGEVDLVVIDPAPNDLAATLLMQELHEQYPKLPMIVLTAYDTPRLRAEMRALGVRYYLAKPALLRELERDIRAELAF
jgi:DNA-binding NarL/FixJ family response regulator